MGPIVVFSIVFLVAGVVVLIAAIFAPSGDNTRDVLTFGFLMIGAAFVSGSFGSCLADKRMSPGVPVAKAISTSQP